MCGCAEQAPRSSCSFALCAHQLQADFYEVDGVGHRAGCYCGERAGDEALVGERARGGELLGAATVWSIVREESKRAQDAHLPDAARLGAYNRWQGGRRCRWLKR